MMEPFNKMVARVLEVDCFNGCRVGRDGLSITLLQFADDSLMLFPNLGEEVCYLWGILLMFESILGLKINLPMNRMMAVGDVSNMERLANLLGCVASLALGMYLGLPLGGRLKTRHIWDPIVERVDKRLARWKGHRLSKGGRLTLIKVLF